MICQTTTTKEKETQKVKTNKRKGQQETKGFESNRKIVFSNITSELVKQDRPYRGQQKHQRAQLVFLFLFSMSHLALVTKQPKPDYCRKTVVSELFFLFYSSCAQDSAHHFCPISVSPKQTGHKNAHFFPKTTSPYKNSGFREKKAPKNTNFY